MTLDHEQRALLGRLADELIPAAEGRLSASAAGVAGEWLDQVLTARPDLVLPLIELLARAGQCDATIFVAELRSNDPTAFGVLAEIVPGAYFMNPDVRATVGYHGQTAHPIDPHPDYLDDGLLDSVLSRGPIYRPTPDL